MPLGPREYKELENVDLALDGTPEPPGEIRR